MTKKHFIAMALEFKAGLEVMEDPKARAGMVMAIEGFMRVAMSINPRFDRSRFADACGLND